MRIQRAHAFIASIWPKVTRRMESRYFIHSLHETTAQGKNTYSVGRFGTAANRRRSKGGLLGMHAQIVTVFLGSFVAGTLFNEVQQWLKNPMEAVSILGTSAPLTSIFFTQYIMTQVHPRSSSRNRTASIRPVQGGCASLNFVPLSVQRWRCLPARACCVVSTYLARAATHGKCMPAAPQDSEGTSTEHSMVAPAGATIGTALWDTMAISWGPHRGVPWATIWGPHGRGEGKGEAKARQQRPSIGNAG